LPAAALTGSKNGSVRMPAQAGRTASATRPRSPVVTRVTSVPGTTAGMSCGWRWHTTPGPRSRQRPA
jgi:hypothetical protein